ncbi:MAG: pyruvate kinase alpha/beta domain-containing protein, partial [Bacteroidota bacterium]
PVQVIQQMSRIIALVENHPYYQVKQPEPRTASRTFHSDVICFNAVNVARQLEAKAILAVTVSGYTAFKVSSCRPKSKIYMFSDRMYMLATLNLVWGVKCFYYDRFTSTDETISDLTTILKHDGKLQPGDLIVNIGSMPLSKRLRTNMLKFTVVD